MSDAAVAPPPASGRRIFGASLAALAVAVLVLVLFVLPAEYGIDPLGSGAAFGLTGLAEPEQVAVETASATFVTDAVSFELQPFESVEYKYRLEEGAALLYGWHAGGDVVAELHAEPDGAPEGFAESFDKRRSAESYGSYRATFSGWHGWFWENRGAEAVTVTLDAAGFFTAARTYRGGHVREEPKGRAGSAE